MSEEIAAAAADLATVEQLRAQVKDERARRIRIEQRAELFAGQLDAWGHRDAASQVRREIIGGPVITENSYARLLAEREQHESQLGAAHAEIARLEEALRDAARMRTIKGARRVVADALVGEVAL